MMHTLRITVLTVPLLILSLTLGAQSLQLEPISTYSTGIFDEGAAEIVAHDAEGQRLFFTNSDNGSIDVLDINDPANPTLIQQLDISPYGGGINSVAVFKNLVAAAVENDNAQENGQIVFFDTDGNFLRSIEAGPLPDMVTFSPDGTKVLSANEGEPDDDYVVDPEGSVTLVDLSAGIDAATATQITFDAFNDQKAALMNRGIRIFGNDGAVTVAQDLEPEFISVSPDNALAYVALQENNALAVIDIAAAEVVDILPLGYKDHLKGEATLKEYLLNEIPWWPDLGTPVYGGPTVKLGGFSGLYYDPITSTANQLSFWAIPDRGPNDATVSGALAGTSQNLRPFKLPNYQARIEKLIYIRSLDQFFIDANPIFLRRADGTPISGRGNIPGHDEVPVTQTDANVFTNADYNINGVNYHELEYDRFGGDFEGIVRTPDFTYWMCDEYRPAIYHFDANGVMIDRFVPEGTSLLGDTPQPAGFYGTESLPEVYNKRRANRGFEALAYDTDRNVLYAFIQTPLYNPDNQTRNNSDVIRILGVDPANGQPVEEYVYLLERNRESGVGMSRVDKIGDAVYKGNGSFYILERDSSTPNDGTTGKKYIFEFRLDGATNILGTALSTKIGSTGPDDKTLEMMTADELVTAGIRPVHKTKVVNLPSIGYLPSDKPEGLALLPDGGLVVLNDNDFGLAGAGVSDAISMGFITFNGNYGYDASDRTSTIDIKPQHTQGMYQPDAIASYSVNGQNYIVTANEGDSRDYDGYSEEGRVDDLDLDDTFFAMPNFMQQEENLGRVKTTFANGDIDGDGLHEIIYSYGARSFSIWDENGNLVFDSGDDFEQILLQEDPDHFNSTNDDNDSFKNRSDDKGAEPEAVTIAEHNGRTYALIGLERIGGIMIYDVTDPLQPSYVSYINNRNFDADEESVETGDLGVEDIIYIDVADSPTGEALVVTANEVSGTISIFGTDASQNSVASRNSFGAETKGLTGVSAFPNPFDQQLQINYEMEAEGQVAIWLTDALGAQRQLLFSAQQVVGNHQLEIDAETLQLAAGIYFVSIESADKLQTLSVIKR
ncbi:MAG: esterase-like activity of phytase family protein [Bacteroidota bacterium]